MPKPPPPPPKAAALGHAIAEWRAHVAQLEGLKKAELALRAYIVKQSFSKLREGINECAVGDLLIRATHKLNRKLDPAVLNNSFRNKLKDVGASLDLLVEYKPALTLSEYRKLTAQQKKLFDSALTISEATPSLTVEEKNETAL